MRHGRKTTLSQETIDEVQRLLLEGKTYKEIGEELDKAAGTIQYIVNRYELKQLSSEEKRKLYIPEELDKVKELLLQGKSYIEIGELVGKSQATISQWVKKYNLKVVPHEYKRGPDSTETPDEIAKLKRLLAEKKTITEITKIMERSFVAIESWIKKYNLDDSHIKRYNKNK